jgi:sulfatase modifying factor 1
VHDMVGNVHEWTDDASFRGGYYLDTKLNGEGCDYRTTAHAPAYYDYSTGFRCCADEGSAPADDVN